jgi:hypothetical protein
MADSSHLWYFEDSPTNEKRGLQSYGNNIITTNSVNNYRALIARRGDASSPYFRSAHTALLARVSSSGYQTVGARAYKVGGFSTWHAGLLSANSIPTNSMTAAANDIALKRIKQKLATDVGAFKTLVPLGEHKELTGMVRSSSEVTADFLKAAISIKKRGGIRRMRKALSQLWLQYSFAVAPTIGAISDLAESIQKTQDRDHTIALYGQKTVNWLESADSAGFTTHHSGARIGGGVRQYSHSYRVRYSGGFLVRIQSLNNYASKHFGITAGDVVSAGYELTPFSWVGDYFTNLGDVLEDVFSSPEGSTYYLTKTEKYTRMASCTVTPVMDAGTSGSGLPGVNTTYDMIFSRSVLGSLPHRGLRIKTLDEIRTNAIPKVLNLVSILGSK